MTWLWRDEGPEDALQGEACAAGECEGANVIRIVPPWNEAHELAEFGNGAQHEDHGRGGSGARGAPPLNNSPTQTGHREEPSRAEQIGPVVREKASPDVEHLQSAD